MVKREETYDEVQGSFCLKRVSEIFTMEESLSINKLTPTKSFVKKDLNEGALGVAKMRKK